MRGIETEKELDELRWMATGYHVIAAWASAGVFAALADGRPHALDALPGDRRALEITARVLVHLGLLERSDAGVALTRTAQTLWQTGPLKRVPAVGVITDLTQLERIVREGGPVKGPDGKTQGTGIGVRQDDPEANRRFMDFLYRRSGEAAEDVARTLAPRLAKGARIADLGGGHGRYAQALASRGFRVTLLDQPTIVQLAKERHGEALQYLGADFMKDELGGPYDAALLSNIVHGLSHDDNARLLQRVREALSPGGLVLIKDYFLDELEAHPASAAFFGVQMLLYTDEGRTYSTSELAAIGQRVGFERVDAVWIPDGPYTLLTLRRAG